MFGDMSVPFIFFILCTTGCSDPAMSSIVCNTGARWPRGLERWTGDQVVLGSNPTAATSLRNFGNSVYPALPVSFGGDSKSRWSLLSDQCLCQGK